MYVTLTFARDENDDNKNIRMAIWNSENNKILTDISYYVSIVTMHAYLLCIIFEPMRSVVHKEIG